MEQRGISESLAARYDFDRVVERRGTDSAKWNRYEDDVLPLWVADLDFRSPEPVIEALRRRVEHGVFGYAVEPPDLRAIVQDRLKALYSWQVDRGDLFYLPGIVTGLNLVCRALGETGDGVLIQPPIYPPFISAPANAGRVVQSAPLVITERGYEIDFDVLERAITPRTRLFLLCNPHNPTGRVFTRAELERLAEFCLRHDLIICSDEIHQDFVYQGHQHLPIASLGPEVAERTITLLSPSKTYNIAGLHFSIGVISNPELRSRVKAAGASVVDSAIGLLGYVAGRAAYKEGDEWLAQVLAYLQANRDFVVTFVRDELPSIAMFEPQGTYLAWLDCRQAGIEGDPADFFLKEAKVALSKGVSFGAEGEGFVRLNFGCSRLILEEALTRMKRALERGRGNLHSCA